jgi:adenine phosphoribosyltransferase
VLRMHGSALTAELRQRITFPDGHADVWPLFYDPVLFNRVVDALAAPLRHDVSKIAGIEARGFLLGAAVAAQLGVGFVAIRKQGGLYPGPKLTAQAEVDYRGQQNILRLQRAACGPGDTVALVDDWFQTASQALAAKSLIAQSGARYVGASIVVDQLVDATRQALAPCHALIGADELG